MSLTKPYSPVKVFICCLLLGHPLRVHLALTVFIFWVLTPIMFLLTATSLQLPRSCPWHLWVYLGDLCSLKPAVHFHGCSCLDGDIIISCVTEKFLTLMHTHTLITQHICNIALLYSVRKEYFGYISYRFDSKTCCYMTQTFMLASNRWLGILMGFSEINLWW